MIQLSRGDIYPAPLPSSDCMVAHLEPSDEGLAATLLVAISRPSAQEIAGLRAGAATLALVSDPAALLIVLRAGSLELDASYVLGRETPDRREALRAAARRVLARPDNARWLVMIDGVDLTSRRIVALRAVSVTQAWMSVLANALSRQGDEIGHADDAVAALYARYPRVRDLLAAAAISEIGGRA